MGDFRERRTTRVPPDPNNAQMFVAGCQTRGRGEDPHSTVTSERRQLASLAGADTISTRQRLIIPSKQHHHTPGPGGGGGKLDPGLKDIELHIK